MAALTPTEVVAARTAGADVVKIFPCGAMGGASYIKALKAPFPHIELMPTGGVSLKTDVKPPIGEFVLIAQIAARVARHHTDGIGIEFVGQEKAHHEPVHNINLVRM